MDDFEIASGVEVFLSLILTRICVPLFFFISGYLFFYKKEIFNFEFYSVQWKKRFKSLLIPYILWNIFALIIILFKCYGPISVYFPRLHDNPITFTECFEAFWSYRSDGQVSIYEPFSTPVNVPLWYIRDLMVMILFSPLIASILQLKYSGIVPIILMTLFIVGIWFPASSGYSLTAVVFFVSGAWFSIKRKDPILTMTRFLPLWKVVIISVILYLISATFEFLNIDNESGLRLHAVSITIGFIMVIASAYLISSKTKYCFPVLWVSSSFFIYAFHHPVLSILKPVILKFAPLSNDLLYLIFYFGLIIFILALSIISFWAVKKLFPNFTKLLCGYRLEKKV